MSRFLLVAGEAMKIKIITDFEENEPTINATM